MGTSKGKGGKGKGGKRGGFPLELTSFVDVLGGERSEFLDDLGESHVGEERAERGGILAGPGEAANVAKASKPLLMELVGMGGSGELPPRTKPSVAGTAEREEARRQRLRNKRARETRARKKKEEKKDVAAGRDRTRRPWDRPLTGADIVTWATQELGDKKATIRVEADWIAGNLVTPWEELDLDAVPSAQAAQSLWVMRESENQDLRDFVKRRYATLPKTKEEDSDGFVDDGRTVEELIESFRAGTAVDDVTAGSFSEEDYDAILSPSSEGSAG